MNQIKLRTMLMTCTCSGVPSLAEYFKIKTGEEIFSFLIENKEETFKVRVSRAAHFLLTGIWINELSLCEYAQKFPEQKVSGFFSGKLHRKLIRYEQGMVIPKTTVWDSCKKTATFVKEYFRDRKTVGAIFPSSKFLAKEIVSKIPKDTGEKPKRILEIGPGTGAFTDRIIKRMNPGDTLDLVEFDESFCEQLRKKYSSIPQVNVIHKSILDHTVEGDKKYDCIVSGLPLNSFPAEFVSQIFQKTKDLAKDGSSLSYFDYLFIPTILKTYLSGKKKDNLNQVLKQKEDFYHLYGLKIKKVALNIFPARVLHHQFNSKQK